MSTPPSHLALLYEEHHGRLALGVQGRLHLGALRPTLALLLS